MTSNVGLSIGAVAKILGVSPHALRKWEERYEAIHPRRSPGGDRRYSSEDLDRLSKLKALIDRGHAISALAGLSDQELDALLLTAESTRAGAAGVLRLAVIGERLGQELAKAAARMPAIEAVVFVDPGDVAEDDAVDALVTELGFLGTDTRAELARLRANSGIDKVVVVYGYGAIAVAEQLSDAHTALVRRPLNARELTRTVGALVGAPVSSAALGDPGEPGLAPRRFSRDQLSRLVTISPKLACECPRNVSQLLIELNDFEQYSADCEIAKPADATIHHMLRRTAASSRALFEQALIELAAAEDIELEGV